MSEKKRWHGVDGNLTHYGDAGFSRYLRRAFLASAGYDGTDLERPVIGITNTCVHMQQLLGLQGCTWLRSASWSRTWRSSESRLRKGIER